MLSYIGFLSVTFVMLASRMVFVKGLTPEQCDQLNPNPTILSCSAYSQPTHDYYGQLDYTNEELNNCVTARCRCTKPLSYSNTTVITGFFCSGSASTEQENGTVTCNTLKRCYHAFFQCVGYAVLEMRRTGSVPPGSPEFELTENFIAIGNGTLSYHNSDSFKSCRANVCAAAASRVPCGLRTCLPKPDESCVEIIQPPPPENINQLCTAGCVAMLLLMAYTIVFLFLCIVCVRVCPAPVVIKKPVIEDNVYKEPFKKE